MIRYKALRFVQGCGILVAAVICSVTALGAAPTVLLEVYDDSLTSFKYSSNTNIQGIRPLVRHRFSNIDGSIRSRGGGTSQSTDPNSHIKVYNPDDPPPSPPAAPICPVPTALANFDLDIPPGPLGGTIMGGRQVGLVDLFANTSEISDTDLRLPAPGFSWFIGRSFNARQEDSGGSHIDSDGYQGCNWFQNSQPELVFYDDADNSKDLIYLMLAADKFLAFNRVTSSTDTFKAVNGAGGVVLLHTFDGVELATFHTLGGQRLDFFWFDGTGGAIDDPIEGSLWRIMDSTVTENPYDVTDLLVASDGNIAYIGDIGDPDSTHAQANGYKSSGAVEYAYDTADRRYKYIYSTIDSVERLTSVEVATLVDSTWTNTGDKVEYEYYQTGHNTYGDNGCLENVIITTPLTDSGVEVIAQKYYRYWKGTFDDTTNPGHPKSIQYIVDFEGVRNFDWSDLTWDDDFETATESSLKEYASTYLEYDSNHRIDKAWFNGACGCSGASNGTFEFRYEDNTSFSDTAGYDQDWFTRTVIDRPDGSWVTQYFDEVGQPLHKVTSDADPDTATNFWITKVERDADGRVTKIHSPANIDAYTHDIDGPWAMTVKSTAGLVTVFDRISTGDLEGLLTHTKHKEGNHVDQNENLDSTVEYDTSSKTVGDATLKRPFIKSRWVYSAETTTEAANGSGPAGAYETTLAFTYYTGDAAMMPKKIVRTNPTVSTGNNGSGTATTSTRYLREDGTTAFVESTESIFTYTQFTDGQLTKRIDDVKTNGTFPAGDDPNDDWGITETGNGSDRTTTITYDDQGRRELVTQPDGRVLKTYYSRLDDRRLVTLRYNDYETSPSIKYFGPVQYTVVNHAGKAEVQAVVALTGNESTLTLTNHVDETTDDPILAIETTTNELGELAQMTTLIYNKAGQTVQETRSYFLIPASEPGTDGTNYDPTLLAYDDLGRRWRVKDATGTIRRTVFDKLGRTIEQWIGTNDFSFSGGESSGPDNMVKTVSLEYDSGNDGGNSYLTKRTAFVQDSDTDKRDTTFEHDVRGRVLLTTTPTAPYPFNKYDNMGRLIATGQFSSTASIVVGTDDPTTETTNRLALSQTFYDERGQVWKSQRHKIDDADGSDNDNLQTLTWYDAAGRVIKVDGSQLTKSAFDRLGRQTHSFTLASDNDAAYADADDVTGDSVLVESQTVYESTDSSDVLMRVTISREHDNPPPNDTGALDTNADSDDLLVTAANLNGRAQITAMWYDRFGRVTDTVQYGTNGGSNFDRDGLSVPARSDTALLTEQTYNDNGTLKSTTDPRNLETRFEYDDLGRQTAIIANYVNGTPSGNNGDDDVHTRYVYTDGLRTKMWVDFDGDNVVDTGDQNTIYTYGTTKGVSAGDSKIQTGHLLQKVQYPDSHGGTDVVTFAYNAQSQQEWTEDQEGNIIETDFDDSGRVTHKRVTTLKVDFDGAVRRISTTYDSLGRRQLVTQYDNATVGSGSVVDEVKYTYEDWGNISKFEQDHDSAIGGTLLYDIDYTYEKAGTSNGRNTIRRTGMDLPDGTTVTFWYSGVSSFDADVSRVSQIKMSTTILARYGYLGVGQVVGIDYLEPDVFSNRYLASNYDALDNFNRVEDDIWYKDLGTDVAFFDTDITYDRNSNITLIEDNIHVGFDADYTIDNLNRLQKAEEGTWNGSTITSRTRQQLWEDSSGGLALDQVGNWDQVRLDLNGDNDFIDANEYDDDRTHNDANELTGRDTDDNGTDDFGLRHDKIGNLTDDAENYEYVYDPFGRLRKVKNTSTQALVAEYTYSGLGHRIGWHYDVDADGTVEDTSDDPWIRFVYDERWRIVGTFRASDSSPKEQFVYHNAGADGRGSSSYIDTVICRDRDANVNWADAADGTLEERIYYCHNWRGDVSVLIGDDGDMVEWVKYSSYGIPFGLPKGDQDSDGDLDTIDVFVIGNWGANPYDVRADLDLDGDVDSTDTSLASNASPIRLGWGNLSEDPDSGAGNRKGYAGYELDPVLAYSVWHVRFRVLNSDLGRWMTRDPLEYVDGMNLYGYIASNPMPNTDPTGRCGFGNIQITYIPKFCKNGGIKWCKRKYKCLWVPGWPRTTKWVFQKEWKCGKCVPGNTPPPGLPEFKPGNPRLSGGACSNFVLRGTTMNCQNCCADLCKGIPAPPSLPLPKNFPRIPKLDAPTADCEFQCQCLLCKGI